MPGPECEYSFDDLFLAAFGRKITVEEKAELFSIPQENRNMRVKEWAQKAKWGTDDRVGGDGKAYTAFCPMWK